MLTLTMGQGMERPINIHTCLETRHRLNPRPFRYLSHNPPQNQN